MEGSHSAQHAGCYNVTAYLNNCEKKAGRLPSQCTCVCMAQLRKNILRRD